jgi:RNA polymerase sigma-70 factor (ECF subfamily)
MYVHPSPCPVREQARRPLWSVPTAEQVFLEFGPRIYCLARRMVGNDTDAEDVAQDVLVQVVRKLDTFRGEADFVTWLHRVTVNAALAFRRKRASYKEFEVYVPPDKFLPNGRHAGPVHRWQARPEQQVLDQEMYRLIEDAIAGLPPNYRDAYVLADVEGLSKAEVADLLGLSVAAVKSRLHRARLLMREALAPYFED